MKQNEPKIQNEPNIISKFVANPEENVEMEEIHQDYSKST